MNCKKIRPQAGNSHVHTQLKNGFFIFLYHNVVLYYLSQNFGGSIEVSAIALEKTREMSYWRAGKCLHFHNSKESKKGTLFQSFLYAFHQGLALVHSGQVSVIVRCPKGESQL